MTKEIVKGGCICGKDLVLTGTVQGSLVILKHYKCKSCKWTTTTWEMKKEEKKKK